MAKNNWLGVLLRKVSLETDKLANHLSEPLGLSFAQMRFLWFLYDMQGEVVCQVDLERAFSMTNPSVTSVLRTLEKKELVRRKVNPDDGRSKTVMLTETALAIQPQLNEVREALEERITCNLSEHEQSELYALLLKILEKQSKGGND